MDLLFPVRTYASPMHANLSLRLTRSAAFSAVCVSLAALAHWLAGGSGPGPLMLVMGGGAVLALGLVLGGRERSTATVGLALAATQVGLHELFGTTFGPAPGTLHHGQGLSEGLGMLLAHLSATLITGWWLARGEAALWAVLRRLGVLILPTAVPVSPLSVRLAPLPRFTWIVRRSALRHIVSRRGPPLPA